MKTKLLPQVAGPQPAVVVGIVVKPHPVPSEGTVMAVAWLVVGPVTAFKGRSLRWLRSFDFRAS
jgi:hypothetical protein